jgi:hypothetical protein
MAPLQADIFSVNLGSVPLMTGFPLAQAEVDYWHPLGCRFLHDRATAAARWVTFVWSANARWPSLRLKRDPAARELRLNHRP